MEEYEDITVTESPNATNVTDDWFDEGLFIAYNVSLVIYLMFTMTAMGSGIKWPAMKPHLRRPIGVSVGMVCQFILMPAMMFGAAHLFQFDDHIAIGVIIAASCPGGASSNVFTFWSRGDLSLSITMTAASTLFAVFFMPLNVFLYTASWTDDDTFIPYGRLVLGVVSTWVPLAFGIFLGLKFPKFSYHFVRVGSVVSFCMLLFIGAIQGKLYPEVYDLHWSVWFCAFIMPYLGFLLGYSISSCFFKWLKNHQRRTIGYETGLQNCALALNLIAISFPREDVGTISSFVLLYGALQIVDCTILAIAHQTFYRCQEKRSLCHQCYYKRHPEKRPPPKIIDLGDDSIDEKDEEADKTSLDADVEKMKEAEAVITDAEGNMQEPEKGQIQNGVVGMAGFDNEAFQEDGDAYQSSVMADDSKHDSITDGNVVQFMDLECTQL